MDGQWGYGDYNTGEVMVQPQWAFCDHFFEHYARFSAKGDFSDLDKECYDGAWGLYDGADFSARLIERDGRWGVLSCPTAEIAVEPTLSREKAEKEFWAWEGDD